MPVIEPLVTPCARAFAAAETSAHRPRKAYRLRSAGFIRLPELPVADPKAGDDTPSTTFRQSGSFIFQRLAVRSAREKTMRVPRGEKGGKRPSLPTWFTSRLR